MRHLGFVVLLVGCSFQSTPAQVTPADASGGPRGDAPVGEGGGDAGSGNGSDAAVASPDAQSCFGVGLVKVCLAPLPTRAFTLSNVAFDTGTDRNCDQVVPQPGGPQLCVIAATAMTVSGIVIAVGARPLVLVGTDSVHISGALHVSSGFIANQLRRGAGADASACTRAGRGANDAGGAGGGAGGSFGTVGGNGGTGDRDTSGLPVGTAAGGAPGAAQAASTFFRGGCSGGDGGGGDVDPRVNGGSGGDGGGAVYLIAGNQITIDGDVFASGAGGRVDTGPSGRQEGAGGGGSGGWIGLDAPMISVAGRVTANGGAGGGGGGTGGGGSPGSDGSTVNWNMRAPAGAGDPNGGAGNGAQGTVDGVTTNLDGADSDVGAGGGAGGLGLVWTYGAVTAGAMISPAPVLH